MRLGRHIRYVFLSLVLFLIALLVETSSGQDIGSLASGVVVERVLQHSEAEKAGIREGDVLLRWARSDVHGEIWSPFGLKTTEIEQAPRGNVTLEGFHSSQRKIWTLGPAIWGIQARPIFSESILTAYLKARELEEAGRWEEAEVRWHSLADPKQTSPLPSLRTWMLFHLADRLAEARRWNEADLAYKDAVQSAATTAPQVESQLLRAWAKTFENRSVWADAVQHYQEAAEKDRSLPDNLSLAMDLENLGNLAHAHGDIDRAEDYYLQSLGIREKLAPASLAVASSLNNLADLEDSKSQLAKAEDYCRHALAIRQKLAPGGLEVAGSWMVLGYIAVDRGDLPQADKHFSQALVVRERLAPGSLDVALALNNLGRVANLRDDLTGAEAYYRRALAIRENLAPHSLTVATSLHNLGIVADKRGDPVTAGRYFQEALAIREQLAPGSLDLAATLNCLGNLALDSGDEMKAEEYYYRTLEIAEKRAPGGIITARSLSNLGVVAVDRGDLVKAEDYTRRALEIRKKIAPQSLEVAIGLYNLGKLSFDRDDFGKAEEYYRQSLAIARRLAPRGLDVARNLGAIGLVLIEQGDLKKAEGYLAQALQIKQSLSPDSMEVARTLGSIGALARQRRDLPKAWELLQQALLIQEKYGPLSVETARYLSQLGGVANDQGDPGKAEEYYLKALGIWEKLAPSSLNESETLASLAALSRREGRLDAASQLYKRALNALEGQTAMLGGSEEDRAGFRAKHETFYQGYIELLMARNQPILAFEVLERSRARMLLEILATAHVDIRRGVSPELLKKERSLQRDIKSKNERRVHLLTEKQSEERVKAVEGEISALNKEYQDVEAQIRVNSPAYAALTQSQPLSVKEIQEQLLDAGTVLLEYSLGEQRSHVFMVSSSSLEAFGLPKRVMIEAASRRVYELLTARNRRPKGEKPAERFARIARADSELPQAAAQLSRMVLGPVAGKLANKRLLIVSDGALNYVPFAALPIKAPGQAAAPLAARHEIVNLPSASVLAVLRRERQGRPLATKTVAVLADPVFDGGDARVKQSLTADSRQNPEATRGRAELQAEHAALPSSTTQTEAIAPEELVSGREESLDSARLTRSAADVGWKGTHRGEVYLPRLQASRGEAEAIVSTAPAGKSFEALDFKANRATATSAELANYRIVHFATHALLNSKHPELSGLVLSLVNELGRPQSGFLGLEDIYNLNLPAELVVLSACETALGKRVEGEGMLGLTRGFMYAGASRVVASLWNISDQATAEQMRHFYRAMLGQGMTPAAALRTAQLKLRQDPRWNSPYFWAAFQIQGEWK